ncbi:SH3 domain-containing protein [Desulfolutivibrio sulfoxidireducens]|nr:SH3 domain-containing protein [Desulfolutivibrio sulfoxidireducens]
MSRMVRKWVTMANSRRWIRAAKTSLLSTGIGECKGLPRRPGHAWNGGLEWGSLTPAATGGNFYEQPALPKRPFAHAATLCPCLPDAADPEEMMPQRAIFALVALLVMCGLPGLPGCVVFVAPRRDDTPPPPVYVAPLPCPAGYGWSPGYGCVPLPAVPPPAYPPVITRVKSAHLNLRSCPGTTCPVIASLVQGEEVRVLGYGDGWTRVYCPGRNLEGWLSGRHLSDY